MNTKNNDDSIWDNGDRDGILWKYAEGLYIMSSESYEGDFLINEEGILKLRDVLCEKFGMPEKFKKELAEIKRKEIESWEGGYAQGYKDCKSKHRPFIK